MVSRWLGVWVGLIGTLGVAAGSAAIAADATDATAVAVSGFVDISAGYQRLPNPDTLYTDADLEVAGGADPRWKPWNPKHLAVAEARARGPSPDVRNATQHAYLLSLRGDKAGAEAGLAVAKQRFPDSVGVHWSEGWIRLNLLDFEGALVAWQQAERLHGGQPFWVPYSKALALMGAGDDEAAKAWWSVAQRAYTPELDTANGARARFRHWRPAEQMLLEKVIELTYPQDPSSRAAQGKGMGPAPLAPHDAARQAEIDRVIAQRMAQMREEAAKTQSQSQQSDD